MLAVKRHVTLFIPGYNLIKAQSPQKQSIQKLEIQNEDDRKNLKLNQLRFRKSSRKRPRMCRIDSATQAYILKGEAALRLVEQFRSN